VDPGFSVAVIGAGPAGALCARELALRGHTVALIGRQRRHRARPVETCSPRFARVLTEANLPEIPAYLYRPQIAFQSSWGSAVPDTRDFAFWHAGRGFALDRDAFDQWLRSAAHDAGATIIEPCRILTADEGAGGWRICASRNGTPILLKARFIVDAAGRASRSVCMPDAGRHYVDKLLCLYADYPVRELERSPATAVVESAPDGWWYAARAPDRCHIAYFTDADLLGPARTFSANFLAKLSETVHLRQFLPNLGSRPIRASDARTSIRTLLWRRSWVALGDAAWTLDPLSGNGIERALSSALQAAAAISVALYCERSDELRRFAIHNASAFERALRQRAAYYGSEARWPDHLFWSRRASAGQFAPVDRVSRVLIHATDIAPKGKRAQANRLGFR
jgi:flavin-dependent dehydrogenase